MGPAGIEALARTWSSFARCCTTATAAVSSIYPGELPLWDKMRTSDA